MKYFIKIELFRKIATGILLSIMVWFSFIQICKAGPIINPFILGASGGGGGGTSEFFREDFTETNTGGADGSSTDGYDSALATTESGTTAPDPDSTDFTSPQGGQCLKLIGNEAVGASKRWASFTGVSEFDLYFQFRTDTTGLPTAQTELLRMGDASGNSLVAIYMNTDKTLKLFQGSISASTVTTCPDDTWIHVWIHGVKGGGTNDGTATLSFSTDGIRPTSGNQFASVSTGSWDSPDLLCTRITSLASAVGDLIEYFDHILISSGTGLYGDNPP